MVLATKYTLSNSTHNPNKSGNHRKNLIQSVEKSLKRLKTDYIDLLWVHAWDFTTPVEEVMRALDDLVSSGKVFYIGVSDTPAWVISTGQYHGRIAWLDALHWQSAGIQPHRANTGARL